MAEHGKALDARGLRAWMEGEGMLPPPGTGILAACSGGADSVALLHLLHQMEDLRLVCAHFNHRLRGEESDRDEGFVRALCADWGVPFVSGGEDVAAYAARQGLGVEEAARERRYRFLRRAAAERGCALIATAHNAGDNAETVLFHLLRGSGTLGLCGIPPRRGGIIRPLLNVSRREIEDYLSRHGLPHVEDSSNADLRYTRNSLRRQVLPMLEALRPGASARICAAAALLREDEDYLGGLAEEFIKANCRPPLLPLEPFRALPRPVAMRVLRTLAGSPGRAHLLRLYALCTEGEGPGALEIPGMRVLREGAFVRFGAEELPPPLEKRPISPGETLLLPGDGRSLRCFVTENTKEIHKSFNTFYFKSENICDRLYVAFRAPGDSIRLAGRGCTKSLGKLFREAGLSGAERARRLVISDGSGPVAVEGFGVAERCAAERGKPALCLEIHSEADGVPPPAGEEAFPGL
ncbi:MAG: tRNA lysidine(34) synthetase TilS [Oscillospiraceae bacterium]|nr:tRNA lysidine(34) synthetase TilS [Oscillospiraceae bacterium]